MADGLFYVDSKAPHSPASGSTITLTGTAQILLPASLYPAMGSNYFGYVGKALRLTASGQLTTGATPGNIQFSLVWGPGTSNTGINIATVALIATANLTATAWTFEAIIRCRACGAAGSLFAQGWWFVQSIGMVGVPPSSPAAVTLDLTQNYLVHIQVSRSGSTAETIQLHDLLIEALN